MGFSSLASDCGSVGCSSSVLNMQLGLYGPSFGISRVPPKPYVHRRFSVDCSSSSPAPSSDPLLVRTARGDVVSRSPAWIMRQAGRYMAVYRKLAEKHASFRQRSETTDLIMEISLQPWQAFRPDGVIIFSDILTPLLAFGVPFDIEVRGPVIHSEEDLMALHPIDLSKLHFVGESLDVERLTLGSIPRICCCGHS